MNPVTLKDRRLRSGEVYELPEAQLSPIEAKVSDLMDAFSKSTADIVRTIATRFNLGGVLQKKPVPVQELTSRNLQKKPP